MRGARVAIFEALALSTQVSQLDLGPSRLSLTRSGAKSALVEGDPVFFKHGDFISIGLSSNETHHAQGFVSRSGRRYVVDGFEE